MSDLSSKKTTKREFLKIFGLSSASLLASGSLADELLAEERSVSSIFGVTIPVVSMIRPNAFRSGRNHRFACTIVFPRGFEAAEVDVSSVRCEGARALGGTFHPNGRTIVLLCDSGDLRDDLPCGFSVPFTVTGQLSDGSTFRGSDTVAFINADQSIIYHTSTRRRKSCSACRGHAVNRIYSSRQAADVDRAHLGCNCRIVEEKIGWQDYLKAFWPRSRGDIVVHDRRWGWPPPSPVELNLEFPATLGEYLRRG